MANIKITQLPTATTIGDNDLIPVVTGIGGTPVTEHITKYDFAATLGSSPVGTNPVENTYSDIASMLADQSNQTTNYFNYVVDASSDPNVISGDAYYEKLTASTTTLSTDYRLLSGTETEIIRDSNSYRVFRIQAIQDDGTPLTSVGGGRISFEYSGTDVTAILFNARYTDAIAEFYGKDVNVRFYNRATKKYQTEAVASTAWTTVNTDYYRAAVTGTNIQIADLTVNDRVEFFIVESSVGGGGSDSITWLSDITTNTTFSGTQKGAFNFSAFNSVSAAKVTIDKGTYVVGDVIPFTRVAGTAEIEAGTNVRLTGVRDIDNKFFINNIGGDAYVKFIELDGSTLVGSVNGNIKKGYLGAVNVTSYTSLGEGETAKDVTVYGTGFSANMKTPIVSANATLNSWTYVSPTEITLNLDAVGSDGDTVTITYNNGDITVDTDAITINSSYLASLIAYFRFNDNLTDEKGNYTASGTSVAYATGQSGNALDLAGGSQYVTIPDADSLSFGDGTTDSPFSFVFSLYIDTLATSYLISKRNSTIEYQLILVSDGTLQFLIYDESASAQIVGTTSFTLNTSTWYVIQATYDGSGTFAGLTISVDDDDKTLTDGSSGSYIAMENGTSDVAIGTRAQSLGTSTLDGRIDNLGIFTKELSTSEKTSIYNTLNGGSELI